MKEIAKSTTVKTLTFKCDVCSGEYLYREDALACEKRHEQQLCAHKNLDFEYQEGVWVKGGSRGSGDAVEVVCKDCGAYLGRKELLNKQSKKIQKFLEGLFLESTMPLQQENPDDWVHVMLPKRLKP